VLFIISDEKVSTMPDLVYQCKICGAVYVNEQQAEKCEAAHRITKDKVTVLSVHYENCNGLYGTNLVRAQRVPGKLLVRFSAEKQDYATYVLERYGPRWLRK
jgi:hypothetical protein